MPMVRVYITEYFIHRFALASQFMSPVGLLRIACGEIVPAGFNSQQGPLTPGSIEFIPMTVELGLSHHVVIDIEAYRYEDRATNIEERAQKMKEAFNTIFPHCVFAVWAKLVTAGWSSDTKDPDFDGDMSMEAAIERYTQITGHHVLV